MCVVVIQVWEDKNVSSSSAHLKNCNYAAIILLRIQPLLLLYTEYNYYNDVCLGPQGVLHVCVCVYVVGSMCTVMLSHRVIIKAQSRKPQ